MIIIGLTGCIASGKSTVSAMLAELGAKIIDADIAAKSVVSPGEAGLKAIVDNFGKEFLLADGNLNRALLAEKVFQEENARVLLNSILHPLIKQNILQTIVKLRQNGAAVIVLDIPLLFETGWNKHTDVNWVVAVDDATLLRRLMKRNNYTEAAAKMRIASQLPLAEKVKLADVVIDNSKDLSNTKLQVEKAWHKLTAAIV